MNLNGSTQQQQVDAQPIIDNLANDLSQLHVENAMLRAQLAQRDEHIGQLQKIAQERSGGHNGGRVTTPGEAVAVGDAE